MRKAEAQGNGAAQAVTAVMHNLYFYNDLTGRIRDALDAGQFAAFRSEYSERLAGRAE